MKKMIILVLTVVLLLVIIAIGFLMWNNNQKKNEINQLQNKAENQEQAVDENNLVWYEIPELGVRFKVTQDTKEDLRYKFKKYGNNIETSSAMFYSVDQTDENLTGCSLSENYGWSCGFFQLGSIGQSDIEKYTKEVGKSWCIDAGGIIVFKREEVICGYKIIDNIITDEEYKKFFDISARLQDKNFGIYLNTIEQTQ